MDNAFNRKYTENSLIEELALLERHYRDGSYKVCTCVPEKHLPLIAGLSSEMVMFLNTEEDKMQKFYAGLARMCRFARTAIEEKNYEGDFLFKENLVKKAKADPNLQHKISECVENLEKKVCKNGDCKIDPLQVCKANADPKQVRHIT